MKRKPDRHMHDMALIIGRINEQNEQRHKLMRGGAHGREVEDFDRRQYESRHAFEKQFPSRT